MVNTATGKGDDSDEEKAALVRKLQKMEAEEEHDGMFDNPVPFGSAAAKAIIGKDIARKMHGDRSVPLYATAGTTTTSVSCDADDGADHFVYTDASQDKTVWQAS